MESCRIDAVARALGILGSRRGALVGLLSSLLPWAPGSGPNPALEVSARKSKARKRHKNGASAEGPCGNGGPKQNRCKRHGQCCTGYCHKKKRCRCKSQGQTCTEDRNCCPESTGRTCQEGACRLAASCGGWGQACSLAAPCCAGLLCHDGACACGDVCASGCQFTSLQEAIDAADSGATLRLCAETYQGPITIGKALTLIGVGDEEDGSIIVGSGEATEVVSIFNTPQAHLEGVRISGGKNASGAGGLFVGSLPTVSLTNCTVADNEGDIGGGIFNQGQLTLMGCAVANNSALRGGGGIDNSVIGILKLIESSVTGNEAGQWGGGIRNFGALNLENCAVTNNSADDDGGGIYNGDNATLTANATTIADNSAQNLGGGAYNTGALSLTDSNVTENVSGLTGGGIHSDPGAVTLTNSSVTGNTADEDGGGIFNNGATVTLTETTVEDNDPDNCAGDPVVGCSG